jgi:putative transposase
MTDSKTLKEVVNCLTEYIPNTTQGKCSQQTLLKILIRAASQKDSIENTSKVLKIVPTSNDICYHLEEYENLASLEIVLGQQVKPRR